LFFSAPFGPLWSLQGPYSAVENVKDGAVEHLKRFRERKQSLLRLPTSLQEILTAKKPFLRCFPANVSCSEISNKRLLCHDFYYRGKVVLSFGV